MNSKAKELIESAEQVLFNAEYQDGQAIVCTLDCEALERAIKAIKEI